MSRGKKHGECLAIYVPIGTTAAIDKLRGRYMSRSKWILRALDKELEDQNSNNGTLPGAKSPTLRLADASEVVATKPTAVQEVSDVER
jgi:hypothetical protein